MNGRAFFVPVRWNLFALAFILAREKNVRPLYQFPADKISIMFTGYVDLSIIPLTWSNDNE